LGELIDKNYGLLIEQVLTFRPRNQYDKDEYIQVGCIGMIKAIQTFNPKKASFSTYATICIRNEIINFLQKENKHRFLLDLSISHPESKLKEDIWELLPDNISQEEIDIVWLRLHGHTRKEMAKELGYSENQIRYLVNKLLNKIREANERDKD
jgi:RNA polymerase sigma factor (sigma-70 family)